MCSLSTAVHLQGEKTGSNWLSLQKACWHCSVPVICSCLSQPYSPSTDPLEIPSASLQLSFSSPAVLLVTQRCLCSPWMSDSPCTAGTEPIKGFDCKVPTEKSPLQTHRHWVPLAWLWESPLFIPLSPLSLLGCCSFPSPLPSAPFLSHSLPSGMTFRSTPAAHRRAQRVCPNNSCLVSYGWEHPGKQVGPDLCERELYKEIILLFLW